MTLETEQKDKEQVRKPQKRNYKIQQQESHKVKKQLKRFSK